MDDQNVGTRGDDDDDESESERDECVDEERRHERIVLIICSYFTY